MHHPHQSMVRHEASSMQRRTAETESVEASANVADLQTSKSGSLGKRHTESSRNPLQARQSQGQTDALSDTSGKPINSFGRRRDPALTLPPTDVRPHRSDWHSWLLVLAHLLHLLHLQSETLVAVRCVSRYSHASGTARCQPCNVAMCLWVCVTGNREKTTLLRIDDNVRTGLADCDGLHRVQHDAVMGRNSKKKERRRRDLPCRFGRFGTKNRHIWKTKCRAHDFFFSASSCCVVYGTACGRNYTHTKGPNYNFALGSWIEVLKTGGSCHESCLAPVVFIAAPHPVHASLSIPHAPDTPLRHHSNVRIKSIDFLSAGRLP